MYTMFICVGAYVWSLSKKKEGAYVWSIWKPNAWIGNGICRFQDFRYSGTAAGWRLHLITNHITLQPGLAAPSTR